jgi:hypothetical protein
MKDKMVTYFFPFLGDKYIQVMMAMAGLSSGILGYIFGSNWEKITDNPQFWSENPNLQLTVDILAISFIVTMAAFSWRYFKNYFDEFEARKSQLTGFWAISIIIGGSYIYSMLEYRFDLPPQPGWVWTAAINGVIFICWLFANFRYRT